MLKPQWIAFLFRSAFRNLGRTPRRTAVSLLAIAAAAASLLLFDSFVGGVKRSFRTSLIRSQFGHYKIFAKGYRENKATNPFGYEISDPEALRRAIDTKVANLAFFGERIEFFGLAVHGDQSIGARGVGIDSTEEIRYLTEIRIVDGRHLAYAGGEGVLLGEGLAKQLGAKVGDNMTLMTNTAGGSLNALDATVTGTFRTGVSEVDEGVFYIDNHTAKRLLRIAHAPQVLFAFEDDDELKFKAPLRALVAQQFPQLECLHWHELIGTLFDNSMGWLEGQIRVFRFIILIIATLSITNVFMISVMERTGEFGTLRALGTFRGEVASLILMESLLQSALGALLGVGTAVLIIKLGLSHGIDMPPPPSMSTNFHVGFALPWKGTPAVLALCAVVAAVAGIVPAMKIARMNIVAALGRNV